MVYIQSHGAVNPYPTNETIQLEPTTSYDYWWPNYAVGDTPILTALFATTSDAYPNVPTGVLAAVLPSDIPTASLIQITALPPARTSLQVVLPKLPYRHQLNILYVIPLFVTLGVVLGAVTVVFSLKLRENRRRRLLRASTLMPGPPYAPPPENEVGDCLLVHGYPSMEQVSLFAASTPSKSTIHGSRYTPGQTLSWQSLDVTQPLYARPNYTQTIVPSSDGERFTVVTQEDPFLVASPIGVQQSPKLPGDPSLPRISISPSLPDPTPRDDTSRHGQATNLPKPYRRSMFDILKLKGRPRPIATVREEYTALAPHNEPVENPAASPGRRASSVKTARDIHSPRAPRSLDGFDIGNMGDALGLLGPLNNKQDDVDAPLVSLEKTCLVQSATLSSPTLAEKTQKARNVIPFSSEVERSPKADIYSEEQLMGTPKENQIEEEKHPDIYTMAPQRHRSRTPHKGFSKNCPSRRASAPDTHASILPLSPPSLMSSPLEKSLFFTSSLSSSASLSNHINTPGLSSLHHADKSPELSLFPLPSSKVKTTKKLRTTRPEPPLPYPLYPEHVHAQRTLAKRSISIDTRRPLASPSSPSPKGRSTSAMHRQSATGICSLGSLSPTSLAIALAASSSTDTLNKVNDIVAEGYTKKRKSMGGGGEATARRLSDSIP